MSQSAIRLLTLVVCAATVATVTPASAKHHKVHRSHIYQSHGSYHGFSYSRPGAQAWPSNPSGSVCPGMGRSFDCKIWPPPFDEDPDRKTSGSDGA
jgi:hypothetical protein